MVSSLYAEAQHLIILYSLVLWSDQPSSGTSSQTGFHVSLNSFVLCSTLLPATYKQLYCETHRTSLLAGTKRGKLPSLQNKHLASRTEVPTAVASKYSMLQKEGEQKSLLTQHGKMTSEGGLGWVLSRLR